MMKILVVGDTHGYTEVVKAKIDLAVENGSRHMLVVGDWGHWPGYAGIKYLDYVNAYAMKRNVIIYVLGGNHEWWPDWLERMNSPTAQRDANGFVFVRSNLLYAPKVLTWKWSGKQFAIAAGAASIDREARIDGLSWWPEEEFSKEDLEEALAINKKVDYLFTHDCSNYTSFNFSYSHPASEENRRRIDEVIKHWRPDFHFHGHMHNRFEWDNHMVHGCTFSTKTYGLDCNGEKYSAMILDVTTGKAEWVLSDYREGILKKFS